jgi:alpha-L-arabinofuranosidase
VSEQKTSTEYHVALTGSDSNPGTALAPLQTIQAAANLAQPGDTVTVHEGVYRERIDPPRGGVSEEKRIVYHAASGETVEIKGSEVIKDWRRQDGNVWMVTIPNAYFGAFNPYANVLSGDWFFPQNRTHHSGAVYLNDIAINEVACLDELFARAGRAWFAKSTTWETRIWANFGEADPNEELVEINKRQTVFYPSKPGINYLTVRGFALSQAATPWSPPTTEQVGLIGVNWSRGWIIEDNTITHSRCTGITLGKYFDREDGKLEYGFNAHYQTVKRVLARGDWTPENIGHHVIRSNHIAYCGQSGIVGSHGGAFCTITGNVIHDIHIGQLFGGFEQAGIKLHAPVDTIISQNLIFNCNMGVWLDWMTQGTRVSGNTLFENQQWDLFIEVSHGPYVVDNNWLMSTTSLRDAAQGGAYVHNLFGGKIVQREEAERSTPYFEPHSTELAGEGKVLDGDERFYNNIFMEQGGLQAYDGNQEELWMDGNVFLYKAKPCKLEAEPLCDPDADTRFCINVENPQVTLELKQRTRWGQRQCQPVTTERLGKAKLVGQLFENPDGTPISINNDYFGSPRNPDHPFPGPVELKEDIDTLKLWPPNDEVRTIGGQQQQAEECEIEPR